MKDKNFVISKKYFSKFIFIKPISITFKFKLFSFIPNLSFSKICLLSQNLVVKIT